jgi:hypothetical protein
MKSTTATHNVASHYMSAIINNDYSGLEPEEVSALNTWLTKAGLSFADAINWRGVGFCRDEVGGLLADCHQVTWKV